MSPLRQFYQSRVQHFADREKTCVRQNNRYTWLRLLTIVAAGLFGVFCYPLSAGVSAGSVLVCLVFFTVCLKKHLANIELQQHQERLKTINQQELNGLEGDLAAYASGTQYEDPKHDYTADLDVFGNHSLFRFLNRTTSPSGSDMLAEWLKKPADIAEIKQRQQAVKELAGMIDLRQEIQAVGLKYQDVSKELPKFIDWLHSKPELSDRHKLLHALHILPWITIAAIVAATAGWILPFFAWVLAGTHFTFYGLFIKRLNALHQQVSRKVAFISTYSELMELVVDAQFTSPCLVALRKVLIDGNALQQIKNLQNRIRKLDYRLNMLYIPVNILFFFDYKHIVWLERWRNAVLRQVLPEWFDALARIEALSSLANTLHNNPDWAIPQITDSYFTIEAKNIGHPLIPQKERVCNDFSLIGSGQIAIVTGSNMSGKSTFERCIGVNMVLALSGAPVCADALTVTRCQLYTFMRIADNLEEHTSSFYAELKRLKRLIDITKEGQVFFLLDEVLRGTNSRDRRIGSMALVRQLVRQQVSGVIATHDLALGELENELTDNISNAHFDVRISGDDMAFDYQLHRGICTSLNASILMKKIGIEVD